MKAISRIVVFSIVCLLILGGISSIASQSGTTMPDYSETDLTAKASLQRPEFPFKTTDDGLLVVLDATTKSQALKFLDSTGVVKKTLPIDVPGSAGALCVDPSSAICIYVLDTVMGASNAEPSAIKRAFVVYSAGGKKLKTLDFGNVAYNKKQPWYVVDVAVDLMGMIYCATSKGIEVFDPQGRPQRQLASYQCRGLEVDRDGMLYSAGFTTIDYKSFVEKLNPSTGGQVWRIEMGDMPLAMRLNRVTKTIAVLDKRFVTLYSVDGKLIGRVFEMKNSSVTGNLINSASFAMDASGNVFFITRKQGIKGGDPMVFTLLRYSPTVVAARKKSILTISHGYWFDRYPDIVINAFQKKFPDWEVKIERVIGQNETSPQDQISTSILTEAMAGKGADIFSLRFLPYQNFIDKGLLVNLDRFIYFDKDFDVINLRSNVLSAARSGNGLYILPISFLFDVLFVDSRFLKDASVSINDTKWKWSDFFAICDRVRKDTNSDGIPDRFAFPKMDPVDFFQQYVLDSIIDQYFDQGKKQAHFDSPDFIALVKSAKDFMTGNNDKNPYTQLDVLEGVQNGGIVFFSNRIGGPLDLITWRELFKNGAKMLQMPDRGASGDMFSMSLCFGINASARNTSMAWEFFKLLTSREMQQDTNLFGCPINTEAYGDRLKAWRQRNPLGNTIIISSTSKKSFPLTIKPLMDADITQTEAFLSRITRLQYQDQQLNAIIITELKEFFYGSRSAERACKSIQEKVMMYLWE